MIFVFVSRMKFNSVPIFAPGQPANNKKSYYYFCLLLSNCVRLSVFTIASKLATFLILLHSWGHTEALEKQKKDLELISLSLHSKRTVRMFSSFFFETPWKPKKSNFQVQLNVKLYSCCFALKCEHFYVLG